MGIDRTEARDANKPEDERHLRGDVKMIRQALLDPRFDISQEKRDALVAKLMDIVKNATDSRAIAWAAETLRKCEEMVQKDQHRIYDAEIAPPKESKHVEERTVKHVYLHKRGEGPQSEPAPTV